MKTQEEIEKKIKEFKDVIFIDVLNQDFEGAKISAFRCHDLLWVLDKEPK